MSCFCCFFQFPALTVCEPCVLRLTVFIRHIKLFYLKKMYINIFVRHVFDVFDVFPSFWTVKHMTTLEQNHKNDTFWFLIVGAPAYNLECLNFCSRQQQYKMYQPPSITKDMCWCVFALETRHGVCTTSVWLAQHEAIACFNEYMTRWNLVGHATES